ncbi:hypothetical protein PQO03_12180 [Lentisphaera profundi]|uniref:Uncharacterized protein n=1 Tax=Lentisphaera profundi TaxID=1658616 RepID=A0ABY7VWK5_9BACT|nr:hypothetical protein [Lentisphaera profundi]WDE98595.1 hypothetical protein PQO03_12180 [Lentisphaera profundi]
MRRRIYVKNLENDLKIRNIHSATELKNGHTIIAAYHSDKPLFEVSKDKNPLVS